jgi:hypothetical protein
VRRLAEPGAATPPSATANGWSHRA